MKKILDPIELLEALTSAFGPTGCEDAVADLIVSQIDDLGADISRDRLHNVIAKMSFGEPKKKIMLSAHMDEVGFMVTEVAEGSYLKVTNVGGISGAVLSGRHVVVGDERSQINGVIASKAIHQKEKEERENAPKISSLFIDIGAKDADEAKKYVDVGSFGTFAPNFKRFGKDGGLLAAKALDDRLGCALLIEVMRRLREENPTGIDAELYFSFTTREEVGLSGAQVAAQTIAPDFSIVLETTAVADLPDVPEATRVAKVGEGGAISLMDRSTIYGREIVDFALSTAKEHGIPVQVKKYVSGGNDAGHIHKSGVGVKTLALSAPTRYLHSPVCVASYEDYKSMRELVYTMITNWRLN